MARVLRLDLVAQRRGSMKIVKWELMQRLHEEVLMDEVPNEGGTYVVTNFSSPGSFVGRCVANVGL
jgi:hypothetical protein